MEIVDTVMFLITISKYEYLYLYSEDLILKNRMILWKICFYENMFLFYFQKNYYILSGKIKNQSRKYKIIYFNLNMDIES